MHETTTRDDESNEILTAIQINVPPHIRVARMEIKTFYGDWSQTTDAAIQSACFNSLVYLQKVKVLTIDSIHSAELKKCQRELLAANSWAEAFKDRADKLQFALSTMIKEKNPVLASPRIPTKVNLLQETVDTKNSTDGKLLALSGYSPVSAMKQQCTNEQLLTPSGSSQTTQVINSKNSTDRKLLAPSGSSSVYTMKQLSTNEELLAPSGSSQIAQDVGSKKFTDGPLLAPSGTPPECTMKQKCTNEQLSTPSGSSQITQIGASKVIPSGIPFISLANKPFAFHPNCAKLLRGKWTRVSRLPEPIKRMVPLIGKNAR